jgi:hypothetical protein
MNVLLVATLGLVQTVTALHIKQAKRQDGPVDSGISPDCTFFDVAHTKTDNCQQFANNWQISIESFIAWVRLSLL